MQAEESAVEMLDREAESGETSGEGLLVHLTELGDDATLTEIEDALRAINAGSAALDRLGKSVLRSRIIEELGRWDSVRGPATLADAALAIGNGSDDGGLQGSAVSLEHPEPWPRAVDGAKLLDEIRDTFLRFVVLPSGAAEALALWVAHTYVFDAFTVTPRLAFTSATKRCGKTTAQTVVGALVLRPLTAANLTPAVLYRAVAEYWPATVLVDEADMFLEDRVEMRGLLNAGHFKPSAYVMRTAGDDHEVRLFSVWVPVSVAMIGKMTGSMSTLADRSVEIEMRRKTADEKVERLRLDRLDELGGDIRRKLARWAEDNMGALRTADPDVPENLHDRAADNWRALLAIADRAGGDWPEAARKSALTLSGAADDAGDGDIGPELLSDIFNVFHAIEKETGDAGALPTARILSGLIGMADRPWATWRRGQPMNAHQLGRLLSPFGISSKAIKFESRTLRGYEQESFADAWRRYPPKVQQVQQAHNDAENSDFQKRNGGSTVAHSERGANPQGDGVVAHVALTDYRPGEDKAASEDREVTTL